MALEAHGDASSDKIGTLHADMGLQQTLGQEVKSKQICSVREAIHARHQSKAVGKQCHCSDRMVWDEWAGEEQGWAGSRGSDLSPWHVSSPNTGQQFLPVWAAETQEDYRAPGGCDELGLERWLQPSDNVGSESCEGGWDGQCG